MLIDLALLLKRQSLAIKTGGKDLENEIVLAMG
jgi:hypothetical protein